MGSRSFSALICFEVVPEATNEWNPEHAPQAMKINKAGIMAVILPSAVNAVHPLKAFKLISGL